MKNITSSIFILLLSMCIYAQAQEMGTPQNFTLEKPSDYAQYEPYIVEAAHWLESTPLNEQVKKRKAIQSFIQKWTVGSSSVQVNKQAFVDIFTKANPDLSSVFLAAWARHQLQNPDEKDTIKLHSIGLESMNKVYQLGGGEEDRFFIKLNNIIAAGELPTWVGHQLNQ